MDFEQVEKIKNDNNLHVVQDTDELRWLIGRVLMITGPPKVVLEIGVEQGGSLKYWEQISEEDALIIGVDLRERELVSWDIENSSRDIHHIQGNSHAPETLSKVEKILGGKAVDFLFIDGDHSYEGVKADYENYSKFVRNAGVVAFHDVGPAGPCRRFFNEIKTPRHPSAIPWEICHRTVGIGYARMLTTDTRVCDAVEDADKALIEFTELAEGLHMKPFLRAGTCLGMVREGGYIEGDNDIDVGVIYKSYDEVLRLHKALRDSKFRPGHMNGNLNGGFSCSYWKDDDILLGLSYRPVCNLQSPAYQKRKYTPFLQSFQFVEYKGKKYNIPGPGYLKARYGDWKTPKRRVRYDDKLKYVYACDAPIRADKILFEFAEIADDLHIKCFLRVGTCLGIIRDNGYAKGVNDIDVGVFCSSEEQEELTEVLALHGFRVGEEYPLHYNRHFYKDNILLDIRYNKFKDAENPFLQSSQSVTYKGRKYNVPSPVGGYLEACYGDWKTPLN